MTDRKRGISADSNSFLNARLDNSNSLQLEIVRKTLHNLPYYTLLLDENRKIIVSNNHFNEGNNIKNFDEIFGKGPGDIFQCENALEAGCGNSNNCRFCGIFNTLAECSKSKRTSENACKLLVSEGTFVTAYEFMVRCSPISVGDKDYYILTLVNTSHENRKKMLERIFFHDILNIINGLKGMAQVVEEANQQPELHEYLECLSKITDKVTDTIVSQRDLVNAENKELIVNMKEISSEELISSLVENIFFFESGANNRIKLGPDNCNIPMLTDPVLLSRVLVNMIKNALEVTESSSDVTISCSKKGGLASFTVHNHGSINEEVSRNIFLPMFSTKGAHRGLGTYSMRIIGENYLNGKVYFRSHPDDGTTFSIDIPLNTSDD